MSHVLSTADAASWLCSWDAQQELYMPDRADRLGFLVDLIVGSSDGPGPYVLDLASGPGSITSRIFAVHPKATVVAVDLDPALLAIYRAVHPGVQVCEVDLRDDAWTAALPSKKGFDAVVTATALHWLEPDSLVRLYRDLAGLIRPGGMFINADHAPIGGSPLLAEGCRTVLEKERAALGGTRLDWSGWWDAVRSDPALGPMVDERDRRFAHRGDEFTPDAAWHLAALADAGFREQAVVWRRGGDAIIAAAR